MNTIRKSKVITTDYTVELYDYGKIFVNTDNDVVITIPTPDDDWDCYICNMGNGTTTVRRTNGVPVATRATRTINGDTSIQLYKDDCPLISYVKDLDLYRII